MKRSLSHFRRGTLAAALLLALSPVAMAVDYTWSSGTFVSGATAPNPLAASDRLNIVTGGFKYFDGGGGFVFTNNGTVAWSTTNSIYMQNGADVINNGLWDSSADHTLVDNGGGGLSFTNNGTFRKSAGAGAVTIGSGTGFVNNGTLDAQSGEILFNGGATFNGGSVFSGAGSNVIGAGAHAFNGSFTSANLQLNNGSYSGNAAVLNGSVGLNGGTLAGGWAVASGATLNVGTGGFKYIDGSVVNNGTVNWNTGNLWYLQNGASVTNHSLVSASQSASFIHNGGAATSFVNAATGTLRAEAGRTLSLGAGLGFVNNGGVLDAQAGASIAIGGGAQLSGGTYSGAGSVTVAGNNSFGGLLDTGNIVITGGTQTASAAVLNGAMRWTGGALAGDWTLNPASTMTVEAGAFKYLNGGSFTNGGTVAWNTSNLLYLENGGNFVNNSLFVANADTTLINNGGAQPVFNNTADAVLRAAAGVTLNVSNVLVNSGTLDAEAGATIVYAAGGTFNNNTRFNGAGVNRVNGSGTFNGLMQSANLDLKAGTYSGSNAALNGSVGWTGGTFSGSWTLNPASTLTVGTGGFKYIDAGTFTNNGSMAWNTTNLLYMQNGANWVNNGLFVANASTSIVDNGGAQPILDNSSAGILRASGGSTLTVGNMLRNNGGQLDAEAGSTIRYTGGAQFGHGTQFSGAGSNVVAGNSGFTGGINGANLVLEGGTQTGSSALLSGNVNWTGGRFQGGWQIAGGHTLTADTGAFKYISGTGTTIDNQGTLVWNTSNLLYLEGTAHLQNTGTIDLRADTQIINNGGTPTFVNTGSIIKSAGAGTASIGNGLGFDNQGGTVDVRSGTLALPSNFTNHGRLTGTGTFSVAGLLSNAAGGTLAPGASTPGTLALTGNFSQADGAAFAVDLESLGSHDLFNIAGTAALGGSLILNCFAACSYAVGDLITILDSTGNLSGSFGSNVFMNGFASGAFDVVYDMAADRVQLLVTQSVTAVPEPASYGMLMAGLGVVGWLARRRRAAGY